MESTELWPGVGEVGCEGVHGDVEVGITVGGPAQDGRAGQEVLYGERDFRTSCYYLWPEKGDRAHGLSFADTFV